MVGSLTPVRRIQARTRHLRYSTFSCWNSLSPSQHRLCQFLYHQQRRQLPAVGPRRMSFGGHLNRQCMYPPCLEEYFEVFEGGC